jgi:phytoene dehydrogenase-like protein
VQYQDATLFNVHLAMNGFPRYRAAAFDPDIDRAWIVNIGFESLADFKEEFDRIRQGLLPATPRLNVAVNSLYDPTDAPAGKATGLIRVFAPFALADGGPEASRATAKDFGTRCVERWASVCTNMDDGLIRRWVTETPQEISEKMVNYRFGDWMVGRIHPKNLLEHRPTDELSQYRTPIAGLYLCGASQHPHGYITFAPGYNCLSVIADDFNLEKWWVQI